MLEWWNGVPFARAVEVYADRGDRRPAGLASGPGPGVADVPGAGLRPAAGRALGGPRLPHPRGARARGASCPGGCCSRGKARDRRARPAPGPRSRWPPTRPPRPCAGPRSCCSPPTLWAAEPAPRPSCGPRRLRRQPARTPGGQWLDTPMQDVLAARALSRQHRLSADLVVRRGGRRRVRRRGDPAARAAAPDRADRRPARATPAGWSGRPSGCCSCSPTPPIAPTRFSARRVAADPGDGQQPVQPARAARPGRPRWRTPSSTGELYAQPLPLTDPVWCNDLGRRYPGPAVAVVDANTYSSGDLFAAGWVDHDIGPLVTVGQATGRRRGQRLDRRPAARRAGRHRPRARRTARGRGLHPRDPPRDPLRAIGDGIPIEDLGVSGHPLRDDPRRPAARQSRPAPYCTDLLTNA